MHGRSAYRVAATAGATSASWRLSTARASGGADPRAEARAVSTVLPVGPAAWACAWGATSCATPTCVPGWWPAPRGRRPGPVILIVVNLPAGAGRRGCSRELARSSPARVGVGAARVCLVPGNHNHGCRPSPCAAPTRSRSPLSTGCAGRGDGPAWTVAPWLGPARLTFAYPGLWLRQTLYATHGHLLDVHTVLPTASKRLAIGTLGLLTGPVPARGRGRTTRRGSRRLVRAGARARAGVAAARARSGRALPPAASKGARRRGAGPAPAAFRRRGGPPAAGGRARAGAAGRAGRAAAARARRPAPRTSADDLLPWRARAASTSACAPTGS